MMLKLHRVAIAGLIFAAGPGCRVLEQGPSDDEVIAAVRKSPPAPPTLGPTYLAQVHAVEIRERGRFEVDGRYWPIRVRIRGEARIRVTSAFQLGVADDAARSKAEPVDFVELARLSRDDLAAWRVAYNYGAEGPAWRLRGSAHGSGRH